MKVKYFTLFLVCVLLSQPFFGQGIILQPGIYMTVQSGAYVKTTGTAGLTLKSGSSGTASLLDNNSSGGITVNGTTKVERYIANDNKWHFLSAPVSNAQIWPEFAPTPTGTPLTFGNGSWYWDFYYFNPNCPTIGLYWVNLRYPATTEDQGRYNNRTVDDNNSAAGFGATPAIPVFTPGRGYLVAYAPGWTGTDPTIHSFSGTLNVGSVSKSIIMNPSGSVYNLVGNPYPSAIDWMASSGWTRTDLVNNSGYDYWILNDATGTYGVFNSGTGAGTNSLTRYLASGQAFFVKAAQNGSLAMNNNVRLHNTQTWLKEEDAEQNLIRLKLTTDQNSYSDEMIFAVNPALDNGGSEKFRSMYNEAPEIWSMKNGNEYSIDHMPSINQDSVVRIGIKAGLNATYTLTATGLIGFTCANSVLLEDLKTGTTQELKNNPVYSFSVVTTDVPERLRLHFDGPFGVSNTAKADDISVYASGNTIFIRSNNEEELTGDVFVFNLVGQEILHHRLEGKETKTDLKVTTGVYLVTVLTAKETVSRKVVIR